MTGKGFYAFESYIGVDGAMKNSGVSSITFEVYVDGVKRYDSGLMKSNTPQKFVSVNLNGASTLKLVVTAAGNGNGSDHGDWADAKFLTVLDKSELEQVLLEAESKRESDYTEESLAAFTQSRQQAREVLENETATAQQAAEAVQALRSAMDGLVPAIDRQALQDIVDYASRIDSVSYVDPTWKHRDIRYENFVAVMADYAWVLESPDATQQKVDDTVKVLQYFVEELGRRTNRCAGLFLYVCSVDLLKSGLDGFGRRYAVNQHALRRFSPFENARVRFIDWTQWCPI